MSINPKDGIPQDYSCVSTKPAIGLLKKVSNKDLLTLLETLLQVPTQGSSTRLKGRIMRMPLPTQNVKRALHLLPMLAVEKYPELIIPKMKRSWCEWEADRTRHIPQSIRDEVFARDGDRCTFVSDNGVRCNTSWNLEIDHIVPFTKGGENPPDNQRLLCARHNQLEAERQYGKDHIEKFYRRE
jgi:hypothetical protein